MGKSRSSASMELDCVKKPIVVVDTFYMIGNSYQIGALNRLIKQAEIKHDFISNNIANINTPNYRTKDATFEAKLAALTEQNSDVQNVQPKIEEVKGLSIRQDGNNVNIDREVGNLTKNAMEFEAYSQILASKMAILRSAITGQ